MTRMRRNMLKAGAAAFVAPAVSGRAIAATPGAPLPLPPVWEVGGSGTTTLEAIGGWRAMLDGARTPVVGFSQDYLGPVLRVRRGTTVRIDVRNRIRDAVTTHWHGLHVPGAVDGGPHLAIAPGASWSASLEIDQPAATLWYHSHAHRRTAEHVYWGLAGMLIVDDPAAPDDGLPSNYGVDDLPLIVQDRAFLRDGRFAYSNAMPVRMMGFRGDQILVNGAIRPEARVPKGLVRLRLLNGSNARIYRFGFEDGRTVWQIASDGGLLQRPAATTRVTLGPSERVELLVDFSDGASARLLSAPDANDAMGGMMGGMMGGRMGGFAVEPPAVAGGGAFEVMRFAVDPAREGARRAVPQRLAGAVPRPEFGEPVRRRRFSLDMHGGMMGGRGRGMMGGGMMGLGINGRPHDMNRIDERVRLGDTEIWEVLANDMAHPFHVHATSFQVLTLNGKPVDFDATGMKDTVLVNGSAELLLRFRHRADERAPYMYHCHILEHEDAGMMGQFTVG